ASSRLRPPSFRSHPRQTDRVAGNWCSESPFVLSAYQACIHRPWTTAGEQNEEQSCEHRVVGPRLGLHRPEAPGEKDWYLCAENGDADVDKQRHRRQPREEPDQDQCTADDFNDADEWGHQSGVRNPDVRETTHSPLGREEELLNPFEEEDQSD